MIETKDSLEYLRSKADFEFDINFSDPPYALGSEVIIRPDGKVDYKKANDFMNKWEMPTGEYWEQWFKEAFRTLKHGGYCVMYGMDRQLLLFKYYANLAGFTEQQSLYWYFISNFPKATDLSKQIDKNAGAEREVTGEKKTPDGKKWSERRPNGDITGYAGNKEKKENTQGLLTAPSTDLAKKYEGYKYSISPLKQTNETIMVFQKPYKTGSCLHDTLAYENGDDTCCCGAFDIDGNRVETSDNLNGGTYQNKEGKSKLAEFYGGGQRYIKDKFIQPDGRYPAQTFCNDLTAEVLDRQSGISKGNNSVGGGNGGIWTTGNSQQVSRGYGNIAGCSKILHKCNYEQEDHDLYFYNPKVSKSERNAGCQGDEKQYSHDGREKDIENPYQRNNSVAINNHPTLKPIALNNKILSLFKTPNDQKICYPFAGSGSEVIGGLKAGFTNWQACELNTEYVEIAKARIEYWNNESEKEMKENQEKALPLF